MLKAFFLHKVFTAYPFLFYLKKENFKNVSKTWANVNITLFFFA